MWGDKKSKLFILNDLAFKKVPTTGFFFKNQNWYAFQT
jgi:hypothetical protein